MLLVFISKIKKKYATEALPSSHSDKICWMITELVKNISYHVRRDHRNGEPEDALLQTSYEWWVSSGTGKHHSAKMYICHRSITRNLSNASPERYCLWETMLQSSCGGHITQCCNLSTGQAETAMPWAYIAPPPLWSCMSSDKVSWQSEEGTNNPRCPFISWSP